MDGTVSFGWLMQRGNAVSDAPATSTEKDQVSICSVGRSGVLLPYPQLWLQLPSSTVDTEQSLHCISPVKRLEPVLYEIMPLKSICFDLCRMTSFHAWPHTTSLPVPVLYAQYISLARKYSLITSYVAALAHEITVDLFSSPHPYDVLCTRSIKRTSTSGTQGQETFATSLDAATIWRLHRTQSEQQIPA